MTKRYFLDLTGQTKHIVKGEMHEISKFSAPSNSYICYEWVYYFPLKHYKD